MKPTFFSLFLLLSLLFLATSYAQSYDAAVGLRLGTDWGATVQLRTPIIHKNFVLEGILQSSMSKDEGLVTLLGKQHQNLLSRRLNIFYGGGIHAGWNNEIDNETNETFNGPVGVTGILGLEATFARVNVSYDVKPAINLRGGDSPVYLQTGIAIRYVLAKRHDIWSKQRERERRRKRKKRDREKRGNRWYEVWKRG